MYFVESTSAFGSEALRSTVTEPWLMARTTGLALVAGSRCGGDGGLSGFRKDSSRLTISAFLLEDWSFDWPIFF